MNTIVDIGEIQLWHINPKRNSALLNLKGFAMGDINMLVNAAKSNGITELT